MLNKDFSQILELAVFQVLIACTSETKIESYVVGGFVRDHLLGRKSGSDIDIVSVGSGIDLAKAVQRKLPGAQPVQVFKSYGTAMVQLNDITLEFVGARKESYSEES